MISIVVPVYNTEEYLERCLNSIARQTYNDFECIVVDDGSTDESFAIAKDFERKDRRFKVFHKENGGVSSARNYGIDRAQGDFFYFADSDDELFDDTLQVLSNKMKDDIDLVFGGYVRCNEDGRILYSTFGVKSTTTITTTKGALDILAYPSSLYPSDAYLTLGMAWLNLFRGSIIKEYGLRYGDKHGTVEDLVFLVSYLSVCKGFIAFSTRPVYKYYCMNSDSIMNTC